MIYPEILDITDSWLVFVRESGRLSVCKIITRNGQPEGEIVRFYSTILGERWMEEYNIYIYIYI